MSPTPALHTDRYELTMLAAALADGTAEHDAVFEVFTRRLPEGRGYGALAGIGRVIDEVTRFTFTTEQLDYLEDAGVIDTATRDYLRDWRFRGTITGYREGELYFPQSPVLTVRGRFGDAVLLETLILSILNHDSAVASAASRMVTAAGGRRLVEMGSRRTHEAAAVAAARAAYIVGFDATSNLEAGWRYGVPTVGTSAHAFTLAHLSENAAFSSQVNQLGAETTLLVDTYDIAEGIRNAVTVAGRTLGAVRLDSGDPAVEARRARGLLDSLGAQETKIVSTGDMDEYVIADLATSPIDSYGVGTRLVTGSGHPTAGFVYKLVAIADFPGAPLRPVAKRAVGKASRGGHKVAARLLDAAGHALEEILAPAGDTLAMAVDARGGRSRSLSTTLLVDGVRHYDPSLAEMRARHRSALAELEQLSLHATGPAIPTTYVEPTPTTTRPSPALVAATPETAGTVAPAPAPSAPRSWYGMAPAPLSVLDFSGQWNEFMHYLYLPVRIPTTDPGLLLDTDPTGQRFGDVDGVSQLPERLGFLFEAVSAALEDARRIAPHLANPYVYVTARRGFATPGNPLNRPGWHCDDHGGTDLNYIWTDAYPTRFLVADEPLPISDDDEQSMRDMSRYADRVGLNGGYYLDGRETHQHLGLRVSDGPLNTLLRLSPHVIHAAPEVPNPGGMRSFFKISVSTHRYDLLGNSHNHALGYTWPMHSRETLRNQPSSALRGFTNRDYSGLSA